MRNCCRVFLKTNDDLRSFFWFAVGHDRSIYFASSNSRKYRRGFHALAKIPVGGATVNPETDGRPISREEIDNYHSLHRSGVFASPMIEMGKRIRNKITPLDEHVGPLPLVTILPMEPHKYPVASRTPRPTDMIIDISSLLHQPFALMCYTKCRTDSHPPVAQRQAAWSIYMQAHAPIGDLDLWAIVYANPATFLNWQELEQLITSIPDTEGGKLKWILISRT